MKYLLVNNKNLNYYIITKINFILLLEIVLTKHKYTLTEKGLKL